MAVGGVCPRWLAAQVAVAEGLGSIKSELDPDEGEGTGERGESPPVYFLSLIRV